MRNYLDPKRFYKKPDKINWEFLSTNPCAIDFKKKKHEKIYWELLSANPSAIEF